MSNNDNKNKKNNISNSTDPIYLIVYLVSSLTIRQIVSGDSLTDSKWIFFTLLLIASFIIIESHNFFPLFETENKQKWVRLVAQNIAIVFIQKIIYG